MFKSGDRLFMVCRGEPAKKKINWIHFKLLFCRAVCMGWKHRPRQSPWLASTPTVDNLKFTRKDSTDICISFTYLQNESNR